MGIPDYETVMRPVLALLADGRTWRYGDVIEAISEQFGLTEEERSQVLPSGRQRVINSKVGWAMTYLAQAGLVERPARAQSRITDAGQQVLAANPDHVDRKVLEAFPSFQAFLSRSRDTTDEPMATRVAAPRAAATGVQSTATPQDLIDAATRENVAAVEGEVLTRALALSPRAFELLVVRLLEAMGYGRLGTIEHSGQPGDRGIDGIISQDPLGLDRIYLQAKRYGPDSSVSRPDVQKFVGALMGAQGDRGVFITTSTFTPGAVEEAVRVNARIELIDGRRLARLMVRHGVGVQAGPPVVLYGLDEDFFESL